MSQDHKRHSASYPTTRVKKTGVPYVRVCGIIVITSRKTPFWSANAWVYRQPAEPSGTSAPYGIKRLEYGPYFIWEARTKTL